MGLFNFFKRKDTSEIIRQTNVNENLQTVVEDSYKSSAKEYENLQSVDDSHRKTVIDFVTIDFETATSERNSPCELGLTFVADGKITETKSWLIKPYYNCFDYFNTLIHGITASDVADKPEFNELWRDVLPLVEGKFLIAHNAGFDMSVLRKTLELYEIPFPEFSYSCSYIFSKQVWPGLSGYDLATLCNVHNIPLQHHRAGPDSKATAELCIKAFETKAIYSFANFTSNLDVTVGKLYPGGYKPSETKRKRTYKVKEIVGDVTKHNPDSVFYGKIVVFTGALSSMPRAAAQQIIADIGGIIGNSVTKNTDFLIVGHQDYRVVGDDGMSSKQEKAIALINSGVDIEILSEYEFLKHV
jgi:DNA polymerase-3 subunit epsilon